MKTVADPYAIENFVFHVMTMDDMNLARSAAPPSPSSSPAPAAGAGAVDVDALHDLLSRSIWGHADTKLAHKRLTAGAGAAVALGQAEAVPAGDVPRVFDRTDVRHAGLGMAEQDMTGRGDVSACADGGIPY